MSNIISWYGWKPDAPDIRDVYWTLKQRPIPQSVDLRSGFPDVYDQGQIGSCTANAIAGILEYDQIKQGEPPTTPSRLFIYYNEREMEGTVDSDSGAAIRDGIKSVNSIGACDESLWPYDTSQFSVKPDDDAYTHATSHKSLQYQRLINTDIHNLNLPLADKLPFVFGFTVYDYFESDEMARTGILQMPDPATDKVVGGHAVIGCGYDDSARMILVRNSWGADWGLNGYFFMPYDYITNPNLADDFWIIGRVR